MTGILRTDIDVAAVRARFSSLRQGFAFLDAPGGSQVPDEVGDAIARALREASANLGAGYATSLRVGEILEEAERKAAAFLGCEPREVIFGPNMTSLNFTLSRTAGRAFRPGDEILVSSLDHDGGVAPWLELALDRDLAVRHIELNDDTTLDFDDLERKLGPRTRVVAFACASNAVGTIDYLESIGGWQAIAPYERSLGQRFLDGVPDEVTVYGLPGMAGRVPTFLVNVEGRPAAEVAQSLAAAQIGVWAHDTWYSLDLYKRLGYPDKSVRIGFIHYNTREEVDRLLEALAAAARK